MTPFSRGEPGIADRADCDPAKAQDREIEMSAEPANLTIFPFLQDKFQIRVLPVLAVRWQIANLFWGEFFAPAYNAPIQIV